MPNRAWTEEDIAEDNRSLARAVRLRAFLACEFWKSDLGPYLEKVTEECKEGALVSKPSQEISVEKIALGVMFNSGRVAQVTDMREELSIWLAKGKEAQDRIDLREKEAKE